MAKIQDGIGKLNPISCQKALERAFACVRAALDRAFQIGCEDALAGRAARRERADDPLGAIAYRNGRDAGADLLAERIAGESGTRAGAENAARGAWGEGLAAEHVRSLGWRVVATGVRPCRRDRRCEIDLVAWRPEERQYVFVEVKTRGTERARDGDLPGVDARKRRALLRACAAWLMRRRWHGNFRFDVIVVYGSPEALEPPRIKHRENVPLFGPNWRFW